MAEGPVATLSEHPEGDFGSTEQGARVLRVKAVQCAFALCPKLPPLEQKVANLMSKTPATAHRRDTPATSEDVKRILGELDTRKLLDILALRPTILDVEQASMWLAGDTDVFGAGQPLKGAAGEIVTILTAEEEEEPRRS
jgi:hypothetical protein